MTHNIDALRRRLTRILEKTASAATGDVSPGGFVGNKAAQRRLLDDATAGKLEWRAAHNRARLGLAQLDAIALAREALLAAVEADDAEAIDRETAALWLGLEIAEAALGEAEGLYANAHEARSTPKDIADLGKSAALRGRPAKQEPRAAAGARGRPSEAERDRLILEAIADAKARGWQGTAAIADAKRLAPELFAGLGARGIYAAARRVKKLATKPTVK